MKWLSRVLDWFKGNIKPEVVPEPEEPVKKPYPPAVEKLRCSTGCTGIDCKHHYDPEKIISRIIRLDDGTQIAVSGTEYVDGPPYYKEGKSIPAEEIWELSDEAPYKSPRYKVDNLPDSAKEQPAVWVEGKDPYVHGSLPDEVKIPKGKKYSGISGIIDDKEYETVKVDKIQYFTGPRTNVPKPDWAKPENMTMYESGIDEQSIEDGIHLL